MSKTTSLIKNSVIIGLGTLSTKALTFLLLPLYTRVLSKGDYGLVDVLMTISSLIIPFVAMEMNSSVFRFLVEDEYVNNHSKKTVISTGYFIEAIGLIVAAILIIVIHAFFSIPHCVAFLFYVISLAISKLVLDTTRGYGNTISYSATNIIITSVSLLLNILFIVVLNWGAVAIMVSTAIGNYVGTVFLLMKDHICRNIDKKYIDKKMGKKMMKYALPLIPNTVSWWVVSASDRLIILVFLGVASNGIYAVAHKIPSIYTTLFTCFGLAWTEAVAKNTEDDDFIVKTMKLSLDIMIYFLLGMMSFSSLFFDFLIGPEYLDSYWHIFILLISVFFSSISSLYGGLFCGKMDSKTIAITTVLGAVLNIVINLCFIHIWGLYAASLSTMVSYLIVSIVRGQYAHRWYNIKLFKKNDLMIIPAALIVIWGYYKHSQLVNIVSVSFIIFCFLFSHKEQCRFIYIKIKVKFKKMRFYNG